MAKNDKNGKNKMDKMGIKNGTSLKYFLKLLKMK